MSKKAWFLLGGVVAAVILIVLLLNFISIPTDLSPANFREERPKIMLVGYWPPTNDMIRDFSTSPDQNPAGWIGENWEGKGYDIYSFFPEFQEPNCPMDCGCIPTCNPGGSCFWDCTDVDFSQDPNCAWDCGSGIVGQGDFLVDYQDTADDFWRIANELKPVAIVTFSLNYPFNTNVILHQPHINHDTWTDDYISPLQPEINPPDQDFPSNGERSSTLPLSMIQESLQNNYPGGSAWIVSYDAGNFLSGYLGYHGTWYKNLHSDSSQDDFTIAAGHIHIDGIPEQYRYTVTSSVLDALTNYLNTYSCNGDINQDGFINTQDLEETRSLFTTYNADLDFNLDGTLNQEDINIIEKSQGPCGANAAQQILDSSEISDVDVFPERSPNGIPYLRVEEKTKSRDNRLNN